MPNGLLCETQGFQVNVDTGLVFSERPQLLFILSEEYRVDRVHLFVLNTRESAAPSLFYP